MKKFFVFCFALGSGLAALGQKGSPPKPIVKMTHTTNYAQHIDFAPSMINLLKVPAGWRVKVAASGLGKPRMLLLGSDNQLYVTRRDVGDVLLLTDTNGDHVFEELQAVVSDFKGVHGITRFNNTMYLVADRVMKRAPINMDGSIGAASVIYEDLPDGGQHPNKTIAIGPDGKLYLSVGSTCNDCADSNNESATLIQIDTSTWVRKVYARGLRNTIGFDWEPSTGKLYGVDNGADAKGDDFPGEELNEIKMDKHYGWPYVYGKQVPDETRENPAGTTKAEFAKLTEAPLMEFTAHSAPIDFKFLKNATALPEDWQDDALVTWHGSWDRSNPSGFKVERIIFENGKPVRSEDFLSGFYDKTNRTRFGRPAGIAVASDGTIYISDDANGVIYAIERVK